MTSRPTVLVGFAESASAPEVVWSLVDAGFHVTAFARKGRASALRSSRYVECLDIRAPEADAAGAIADLATIMGTVGASTPVLFPLDDSAVRLCSLAELPSGWTLAGPRARTAELALDKQLQIEGAAQAGFLVPSTFVARTVDDLRHGVDECNFPIILKAARCAVLRSGRFISGRSWVCGDRGELDAACSEWDECVPLMVQPFIEGVGRGVFGIAGPAGVEAWSGHRRLRMMNPHGSGSSACISERVPEELKAVSRRFIEQSGWRGLFMIELLEDRSGHVWFVELNGRPWGSMALARRQGLEYPAWQVALALGTPPAEAEGASGAPGVVCRHLGREAMHLLFVLRGPRSKALRQWPSIWRAIFNVVGIRRSDTIYNWRPDDAGVFVRDCYYTVHDNLFKRRA